VKMCHRRRFSWRPPPEKGPKGVSTARSAGSAAPNRTYSTIAFGFRGPLRCRIPNSPRGSEHNRQCWTFTTAMFTSGRLPSAPGNPPDTDPWEWSCGLLSGSHPGEHTSDTARPSSKPARFRARLGSVLRTGPEADFQAGVTSKIDRAKICNVGGRREVAFAKALVPHAVPVRRSVR